MKVLIVLAALVAVALAGQKRYDGYQVYEVKPRDEAGHQALLNIANESGNYDFWTRPRGVDRTADVMVPPAFASRFVDALNAFNIQYRITHTNVQELIDASMKDVATKRPFKGGRAPRYSVTWDAFYRYNDILSFIREIETDFPNLVSVDRSMLSYENRTVPMIKISSNDIPKRAIFVDGGIHAREWLSPAFTTWLINELVVNYNDHPELVDEVDWYIIPVLNPDGYEFTFDDNGNNRLWRKNRSPNFGTPCFGTDLNRNFDIAWDQGGSADLRCRDNYHGRFAFSEIESQNLRDAMNRVKNETLVYLTFHTYSQLWLTPWGYTETLPDDYADLADLATQAVNALKTVYNTTYGVGSSTNLLGIASGGSDDWAKAKAGVKYSYTVEMRDTGSYGFEAPASEILPNNLEVWEGVKVVANFVALQNKKHV